MRRLLAAIRWGAAAAAIVSLGARVNAQIAVSRLEGLNSPTGGTPPVVMGELRAGTHGHASWMADGLLHVAGGTVGAGVDAAATTTVRCAPIVRGGRLGPWRAEAPLPYPLTGCENAAAVLENGSVLLAGGGQARGLLARPKPDGSIAEWRETDPWPSSAVGQVAVAVHDSRVYGIGGLDAAGQPTADVCSWRSAGRRAAESWRSERSLPEPRFAHGAAVFEGRLYVFGGRAAADSPPAAHVWSAAVNNDGTLGEWAKEPLPLPKPSAEGAAAVARGRMVWVGGLDDGSDATPLPAIRMASRSPQGLGAWKVLNMSEPPPAGAGIAFDERAGRGYMAGGLMLTGDDMAPTTRVVSLRLFMGDEDESGGDEAAPMVLATQDPGSRQTPSPEIERGMPDPPARFLDETVAFDEARRRHAPMLLFVYSSQDAASEELRKTVLERSRFFSLARGIVLGKVDAAARPAAMTDYGAPRVPALVLYSADGAVLEVNTTARTYADLAELTFKVR